jgi:uncharacterized membrane protein (DUF2068 family)
MRDPSRRNPSTGSQSKAKPIGETAPMDAAQRALRTIAGFEAFKGLLAVAAGFGLLSALHGDLRAMAVSLIGHVGLNPGDRYPAMLLHDMDPLLHTSVGSLLLATCGYAVVRFSEAYGLWRNRIWGEWLGALSGALYLPFELWHLVHNPNVRSLLVIAANLLVVGFLGWQLWRSLRTGSARRA